MWFINDFKLLPGAAPAPAPLHQKEDEWKRALSLSRAFGHAWAHEVVNLDGPVEMTSYSEDGREAIPAVPIHWVDLDGAVVPARAALAWAQDRDGVMPSLCHRSNGGEGRYEWAVDGGATHLWVHRPSGVALQATVREGKIESMGGGDAPFSLRHVRALKEMLEVLGVDDAELQRAWTKAGLPWLRLDELTGAEMRGLLLDAGVRAALGGHIDVKPSGDGFEILEISEDFSPSGEYSSTSRQICRLVWTDENKDDLQVVLVDDDLQVVERAVSTALSTLPLVSMRWED